MKHIKRFNEELDPNTYLRTADKLAEFDKDRANNMRDYVKSLSDRKAESEWKKEVDFWKEYGIFDSRTDFYVRDLPNGDYYMKLEPLYDIFIGDYNYIRSHKKKNGLMGLFFQISFIPVDIENIEKSNYIFEESFYALQIIMDYDDTNVNFIKYDIDNYNEFEFNVKILNRQSANKLKRGIIKYISSNEFRTEFMREVLIGVDMSAETGLQIEDFIEYIRAIPVNKLYKNI